MLRGSCLVRVRRPAGRRLWAAVAAFSFPAGGRSRARRIFARWGCGRFRRALCCNWISGGRVAVWGATFGGGWRAGLRRGIAVAAFSFPAGGRSRARWVFARWGCGRFRRARCCNLISGGRVAVWGATFGGGWQAGLRRGIAVAAVWFSGRAGCAPRSRRPFSCALPAARPAGIAVWRCGKVPHHVCRCRAAAQPAPGLRPGAGRWDGPGGGAPLARRHFAPRPAPGHGRLAGTPAQSGSRTR